MSEAKAIRIDPVFVEQLIMDLGGIGAYAGTGVWRTVYSPEWIAAADRFSELCAQAGLAVHRDAVGNVWGKAPGRQAGKSIVSGSHIDTQTPGGRYDGALGALGALVAIKALTEQFGPPRRSLEVVAFCEEESSRFPSANYWGSRAVTGDIRPAEPDTVFDFNGASMADAMSEAGLDPKRISEARRRDIDSFIELHIEQGPILEQMDLAVGVVTGITSMRHYLVELRGTSNHAGAFPMDIRRDPMAGFAEIATGVIATAERWGRPAVTTVGRVTVDPNLPAIIPDRVTFMIDVRHPEAVACEQLYASHEALIREVALRRGLEMSLHVMDDHAASPCDDRLVAVVADAARRQGVKTTLLASGAGHDTQQMARIAKTAMIFVRSKEGRSHTPEEFSSIDDITLGIKVLAAALHDLAY